MSASNLFNTGEEFFELLPLGNSNQLNWGSSSIESQFNGYSAPPNPPEEPDQIHNIAVPNPADFLIGNHTADNFENISDLPTLGDTALNGVEGDILRVQEALIDNPSYDSLISSSPGFTQQRGGWTDNNTYPRVSGDVNGDGNDDIVGFGSSKVYVSFGKEDGTFDPPVDLSPGPGYTTNVGGWTDNNTYPRLLGDVNGDGKDDIVGFGSSKVYVSFSNDNGIFSESVSSIPSSTNGFTVNVGGWTDNNTYPRVLGDVNGDGLDDIVGFGSTNVFVSLSKGDGNFDPPVAHQPGLTPNLGGWTDNNTYPRMLGDVNGDGLDDIIGFGSTNVFVSLSKGDGTFDPPVAHQPGLTPNLGGWTDNNTYPRMLGDVDGNGTDDLIGFGSSDVFVSLSENSVTLPPPPPVWENPLVSGSYTVSQEFYPDHGGIDLAAPIGTPIEAAKNGNVLFVGTDQFGGKYIDIDHGNGLKTRYLHLSTFAVSVGTQVNDDTKIGEVGNTGLSTGPHLHFEVWENGVRQNPRNYINF